MAQIQRGGSIMKPENQQHVARIYTGGSRRRGFGVPLAFGGRRRGEFRHRRGVLERNWQTHLAWLVSRSVVDTLYWTETVTVSRVDVDGVPGDVCVLMWPVVYSRPVVYVTELESAWQMERRRSVSTGCAVQLRVSDWPRRGGWGSNVLPTIFTRA